MGGYWKKGFVNTGCFLLAGLLLLAVITISPEEVWADDTKGKDNSDELEDQSEEPKDENDALAIKHDRVVTLGANLNQEQRNQMLDHFGVKKEEVKVLEVTNPEEYEYLEGIAGREVIGTRAISSVYLELQPSEEGINIETHHITWVTPEMYAASMVTAGVSDVKIVAAAPFPVSGTAALTGVVKAFEEATGRELEEENKQVAHEELLILSELAEETEESGQTTELVQKAKEEILENRPMEYEEIKDLVRRLAEEAELELSEEQISQLARFLEKFNDLDLDLEQVRRQISDFLENPENRNFIARVLEMISDFIDEVLGRLQR